MQYPSPSKWAWEEASFQRPDSLVMLLLTDTWFSFACLTLPVLAWLATTRPQGPVLSFLTAFAATSSLAVPMSVMMNVPDYYFKALTALNLVFCARTVCTPTKLAGARHALARVAGPSVLMVAYAVVIFGLGDLKTWLVVPLCLDMAAVTWVFRLGREPALGLPRATHGEKDLATGP